MKRNQNIHLSGLEWGSRCVGVAYVPQSILSLDCLSCPYDRCSWMGRPTGHLRRHINNRYSRVYRWMYIHESRFCTTVEFQLPRTGSTLQCWPTMLECPKLQHSEQGDNLSSLCPWSVMCVQVWVYEGQWWALWYRTWYAWLVCHMRYMFPCFPVILTDSLILCVFQLQKCSVCTTLWPEHQWSYWVLYSKCNSRAMCSRGLRWVSWALWQHE